MMSTNSTFGFRTIQYESTRSGPLAPRRPGRLFTLLLIALIGAPALAQVHGTTAQQDQPTSDASVGWLMPARLTDRGDAVAVAASQAGRAADARCGRAHGATSAARQLGSLPDALKGACGPGSVITSGTVTSKIN